MPENDGFSKENLDTYLNALSKQYRRLGGRKMPAEIILIGGAAVLANYGFRDVTNDVDALIQAASSMKDAINYVRDEYNLPDDWLNSDFMRTASYSPKISQYSVPYRSFNYVLNVRTISAEYLVAMKLRSGRKYKKDLSDVIGILEEHKERGAPLTLAQIQKAAEDLYGAWEEIPEASRIRITEYINDGNLSEMYDKTRKKEQNAKELLKQFEENYPGIVNTDNAESVLEQLEKQQNAFREAGQIDPMEDEDEDDYEFEM